MTDQVISNRGMRLILIAGTFVIVIWGINQAQSVISLLLFAVFLALIGTPPVLWLERKRIPSIVAVITVMACMVTLLLLVGGFVGASLSTFSDALPAYQENLKEQVQALRAFLATRNIVIRDKVVLQYLNPGAVLSLTAGLLTGLGSALSNVLVILLTVAFILLEASSFPIKLRSILGDPEQAFPQFTKFVTDIQRYMVIKTVINLIGGVLIGLWLFAIGVDFPVLWGFLFFLLHYIPNLGSTVAGIPPVLLALTQLGWGSAALTAAGYIFIGITLGNMVEPRLMGRRLGLSTLVVFLSLIFWGTMLGLVGALLCVPLTMTLKLACEENGHTRWIAVLLGPEISTVDVLPVRRKGR